MTIANDIFEKPYKREKLNSLIKIVNNNIKMNDICNYSRTNSFKIPIKTVI